MGNIIISRHSIKYLESLLGGKHLSQHCVTTQHPPDLILGKTDAQVNPELLSYQYQRISLCCFQSLCITSVIRHLDAFLPAPEVARATTRLKVNM